MAQLNEYHIVRNGKAVGGVKGIDMSADDPRRIRYYVRAESSAKALQIIGERFPGEDFDMVGVTNNVKPHFKEAKSAA